MVNSDLRSPQSRRISPALRLNLFVDALHREKCVAAMRSGADALFATLGNPPDEAVRKGAYDTMRELLRMRAHGSPAVYVRSAPLGSDALERDLAELIPCAPDGVLLENAQTGADVQQLSAKLAVAEALAGAIEGRTKILAVIDSPAAVLALAGFCGASARLAGFLYDEEAIRMRLPASVPFDYEPPPASPLAFARAQLSLGAGAAGVAAIACLASRGREAGRLSDAFLSQGFSGIAAEAEQFEAARLAAGEGAPGSGEDRQKAIF
jgi:citrate lyase subunit beta / citryl-CoA lyase